MNDGTFREVDEYKDTHSEQRRQAAAKDSTCVGTDWITMRRTITYRGPRKWVEATLAKSIHGRLAVGPDGGYIEENERTEV